MKILQFAFGTDDANPFLPHNYSPRCVVYTGTHDNDTTRGWYEESSTAEGARRRAPLSRRATAATSCGT